MFCQFLNSTVGRTQADKAAVDNAATHLSLSENLEEIPDSVTIQ